MTTDVLCRKKVLGNTPAQFTGKKMKCQCCPQVLSQQRHKTLQQGAPNCAVTFKLLIQLLIAIPITKTSRVISTSPKHLSKTKQGFLSRRISNNYDNTVCLQSLIVWGVGPTMYCTYSWSMESMFSSDSICSKYQFFMVGWKLEL